MLDDIDSETTWVDERYCQDRVKVIDTYVNDRLVSRTIDGKDVSLSDAEKEGRVIARLVSLPLPEGDSDG